MSWLGIDIGGASLKTANGKGYAARLPFPLWRRPSKLANAIRTAVTGAPAATRIIATMTGELADCFANKTEGVTAILEALDKAVDGRHARVYRIDGSMVSIEVARRDPLMCAASNWHALGSFCGRFVQKGDGLLIDIGSTTTDLIPLRDGVPNIIARSDTQRLIAGELIYTGVGRSPICALVREVKYRKEMCPVAQELFATTADVYIILGDIPEKPNSRDTADGRPVTMAFAAARLGRNICEDSSKFDWLDARGIAGGVRRAQLDLLTVAARKVLSRGCQPKTIVISGEGEFLARRLIQELELTGDVVSLANELGNDPSVCAPAHAVATLAEEATC